MSESEIDAGSVPVYVVVSPARDEAEYLPYTMRSMVAQTWRPAKWVIVNDGSTDGTGEIAREFAADHDWIEVIDRRDRGSRRPGGGVVEAFSEGFALMDGIDWEFAVKLDSDLDLPEDYFERCLQRMIDEPELGIAGGMIENDIDGKLVLEEHPMFHVRGATKIYRRSCWDAIGGIHAVKGWDTLDELKAALNGYTTRSFRDIILIQRRFTGDGQGQWPNWQKNGEAAYVCGYHPAFVLAKAVRRCFIRPWVIAGAGLVVGYCKAVINRRERVDDPELLAYVREQQWRRLTGRSSAWR
ncbi:MAG: glycosyltransferase family A protein [Acidimicrobiales bacterium]